MESTIMKRFSSLALLVCLAIIAENVNGAESDFSSWKLLTWEELLLSAKANAVVAELKLKCMDTVNVDNALTELRHCLKPVNNLMEEVNTDIDEAKEKEDVLVANQKYCENVHLTKHCFPIFTSTISPCFETQGNSTLIALNTIVSIISSYRCKEGQFVEFFKKDGEKCFLDKTESMQTCINPHEMEYEGSLCNILSVRFNQNMCRFMSDVEKCVITELSKCNNHAAVDFYQPLFDVLGKGACSLYIPSNTNAAPETKRTALTLFSLLAVVLGLIVY